MYANLFTFSIRSKVRFTRLCNTNINFRVAQACCDVAFEYAHTRKQFNQYIAEFQMIQVRSSEIVVLFASVRNPNQSQSAEVV